MEVERIKALVELMTENALTEIILRDGDTRVILRRGGVSGGVPAIQTAMMPAAAPVAMSTAPMVSAAPSAPASPADPDAGLVAVKSPMVGTFYAASGPDSPPFVKVGSSVGADTVVCIIEAMKVFNEIKAEVTGTIERIVAVNGGPVEFGQTLYLVRPG